jgi:hypothetical protein
MASIKKLFTNLQSVMQSELQLSDSVDHPVDKGDNSEESWRNWLSKYLPNRYKVDKATIIDSNDHTSQQIDAVVYDAQYSYLAFKEHGILYLPAESVYAIFEIKPTLKKDYLEYAADKAASVRNLYRTSVPIPHAGGVYPPKPPLPIISGILTTTSDWTPAFGDSFKNILKTLYGSKQIDCGCVISEGSFFYDNQASVLTLSAKEESLINFFLHLLAKLQEKGTVPAIDLEAYAKTLTTQTEKI